MNLIYSFLKVKLLKKFLIFIILFFTLSLLLIQFQLNGLTDNGWYLNLIANFLNFKNSYISIDGGYNYLGAHFSPFWIIFSPFLYFIESPIKLLYFINYLGYMFWFLASLIIVENKMQKKFSIKEQIYFFILFFSSITVLFNYFFNYNGIHEVLFATPFLTLSYYFLFIKQEYNKALLWYLPTLLIKEEFWLLLIFFNIALFISSKDKKYILYSLISAILFYILYFKLMKILYGEEDSGLLSGHYSYIFEAKSIDELFNSIINLSLMKQRIALMFSFFIPFIFLINFKNITIKDILILIFLIIPTMGYCFLSKQTPMTYWLYEHYSLPILPAIFIAIIKYPKITKLRLFGYLIANLILVLIVLYNKQPWQYKYFQDEKQLLNTIKPILELKHSDFILSEDRTGIYFSNYQVDYVDNINFRNNVNKQAKYLIFNTRYSYSAQNLKLAKPQISLSTFDYINNFQNNLSNYGIIYLNYPFIVYAKDKDIESNLSYTKEMLDEWDKQTIEANNWF